jgi:hypothetical protein
MQTFGMKKISTNLEGLNTFSSSMEIMPTERTLRNMLMLCPKGGGLEEVAINLGGLLGI